MYLFFVDEREASAYAAGRLTIGRLFAGAGLKQKTVGGLLLDGVFALALTVFFGASGLKGNFVAAIGVEGEGGGLGDAGFVYGVGDLGLKSAARA